MADEIRIVSDDGSTQVTELLRDGKRVWICEGPSPESEAFKQAEAEQAAVERRREVLRQQLDPKRPDPTQKEIADAQAFIALAADVGVAEALAVADEAIALPVDVLAEPKGGV